MGLLLGKDLLAQVGIVPLEQLLHLAVGVVLHGLEPANIRHIISTLSSHHQCPPSNPNFQSRALPITRRSAHVMRAPTCIYAVYVYEYMFSLWAHALTGQRPRAPTSPRQTLHSAANVTDNIHVQFSQHIRP